MVKLKTELKKNGFIYKQIKRTDHAAIYRVYIKVKKQWLPSTFEVFIIKIRKAGNCMGVSTPESEIFPSNESFGKYAWSFGGVNAKKNAEKLYNDLKNGDKIKTKKKIITFNDYSIIKYLDKENYMILKNGKLYKKPKKILAEYVDQILYLDSKKKTMKELGRMIFG